MVFLNCIQTKQIPYTQLFSCRYPSRQYALFSYSISYFYAICCTRYAHCTPKYKKCYSPFNTVQFSFSYFALLPPFTFDCSDIFFLFYFRIVRSFRLKILFHFFPSLNTRIVAGSWIQRNEIVFYFVFWFFFFCSHILTAYFHYYRGGFWFLVLNLDRHSCSSSLVFSFYSSFFFSLHEKQFFDCTNCSALEPRG